MSGQKEIFSPSEQIEIIKILKGIFIFAKKGKNVLDNEKLLLELLNRSCNIVISIIKDKSNEKEIIN